LGKNRERVNQEELYAPHMEEEQYINRNDLLKDYARIIDKCRKESEEIEQILGKALGYPWYKDDLKNFPNATETDGVCVGDHTAWSLAMCVADLSIARACNPAVCLNIPPKEVLKVPKNVLSKNLGCLYLFLVG
jgi:hypothetical protein